MIKRSDIAAWGAIGLALAFATLFASRVTLVHDFAQRMALPGLLAATTLLAALGVGWLAHVGLARTIGGPAPAMGFPFHLVTGLPLYGTLCFFVGLADAGLTSQGLLMVACAALGAFACLRIAPAPEARASLLDTVAWLAFAAIAVGFVGQLWLTAEPPATLDELAYHLAVPAAWVREGRVVELPLNSHSYFPFGVESASLPLLALDPRAGALASHLVHWVSALAVVGLAQQWLARQGAMHFAWVGAACLATCPALLLTAHVTWTDWATVGASVAVLTALAPGRSDAPSAAALAMALAAGLLTKYTFGLVALGACLAAAALVWRRNTSFSQMFGACVLGGAIGSAFLLRNVAWQENPLYPFGSPLAPHVERFGGGDAPLVSVLRYAFDARMADESLGVSLWVPALLALLAAADREVSRGARAIGLFCLPALALLFRLGAAGRLLVPLLALPALVGLVWLGRRLEARPRLGMVAGLALLLPVAAQTLFVQSVIDDLRPFHALAGHPESKLRTERRSHALMEWLNAELPRDSRTLVLGLHELYWLERPARGGGNLDGPRVAAYLDAGTARALVSRFRADAFTHVAVYAPGLYTGEGAPRRGLHAERVTQLRPEVAETLREALLGHTDLVGRVGGLTLHRIPP